MRHSRRFVLISGAGFAIPTFDGSHSIFGDAKKGYIEIYSSGTLTFSKKGTVDIFLLGGGKPGNLGAIGSNGGAGGQGAAGHNYFAVEVLGEYPIIVGSGSGNSSGFGNTATSGGGASGGAGATTTASGKAGSTGTAIPFADIANFNSTFGGGGGGGGYYTGSTSRANGAGGNIGGGAGKVANSTMTSGTVKGTNGTANTGGGGGGSGASNTIKGSTVSSGGSGLVIVRWGY